MYSDYSALTTTAVYKWTNDGETSDCLEWRLVQNSSIIPWSNTSSTSDQATASMHCPLNIAMIQGVDTRWKSADYLQCKKPVKKPPLLWLMAPMYNDAYSYTAQWPLKIVLWSPLVFEWVSFNWFVDLGMSWTVWVVSSSAMCPDPHNCPVQLWTRQ